MIKQLEGGRRTIVIPDNGISENGKREIAQVMYDNFSAYLPNNWEWTWKVGGKGKYVGTLPKRIGKWVYLEKGIRPTPEQLSLIGNIASKNSLRDVEFYFDLTQDFNWYAGDFGDEGSCFWSCRRDAREALSSAGAWAIRFYKDDSYNRNGYARAWILPVFDEVGLDCYVVFNGYGIETLPIARILATYLDNSYYQKITFTINKTSDGVIWINGGGAGYLVGPQQIIGEIARVNVEMEISARCVFCDLEIDTEECEHTPDGAECCSDCWHERYFTCESCEEVYSRDYEKTAPDGQSYCNSCFDETFIQCEECGESVEKEDSRDGMCGDCYWEHHTTCEMCGEVFLNNSINSEELCKECYGEKQKKEEEKQRESESYGSDTLWNDSENGTTAI